ncbi:MAG: MFS transporter [Methylophagaceae bacterium]
MAEQAPPIYKTPGFIAFLTVAFINAMVDLGHKITIQNTVFKVYDGAEQIMFTTIVNGLILLPFLLVFTPSGFLADRFSKPKIMQWSALAAIVITLLITLGYYQGWFIFAFTMTFVLALQSAIYSPAKYGYIREISGTDRLASANGLMQATTIVAILSGIFIFSVLFEYQLQDKNYHSEQEIIRLIAPIGWVLVILSIFEYLLARRLPKIITVQNDLHFNWQHYLHGKLLRKNLKMLSQNSIIWLSILGLSLFWGVSQTLLATFPAFAKEVLNETNTIIIQGLLACSGIGIIIGSLTAGKLSDYKGSNKLITVGTIGLICVLFILPQLESILGFASAILMFGLFGGLVIVPLNTLIQYHAPTEKLGIILAGNNWIQNLMMISFLIVTLLAATFYIGSYIILLALPIITFIIALIILKNR